MKYTLHIISDGTGKTAERTVNAALVQFDTIDVDIVIHQDIRTKQQIEEVFSKFNCSKCLLVHTVVSNENRNLITNLGKIYSMTTIDLLGPMLSQMSSHFSLNPLEKAGAFHELNKAYFQRIEAIEFAIKHDDGLRPEGLIHADIVILGVSRTFKTPLTIYLANLGWKVGNIPIVMDMELPDVVRDLDPAKVFALTTNPERLSALRKTRDEYLKSSLGSYARLEYVNNELLYASSLYNKHRGWTIIDVTNKPIEEIASAIIAKLRSKYENDLNKDFMS